MSTAEQTVEVPLASTDFESQPLESTVPNDYKETVSSQSS